MPIENTHTNNRRQSTAPGQRRTTHQWSVLRGVNQGHAIIAEDENCEPRSDVAWVRPGSERVRDDLTGAQLLDAIAWMSVRKREQMTRRDQDTLAELKVRAWGWGEITSRRGWYDPAWVDSLVPKRRSAGFRHFLLVLLACYRSGAVGALLGYHECRSICEVGSDSTWRRWTLEMEQAGLIRIIQTWVEDTGPTGRKRKFGKLLYLLGPAFHETAGVGLLEGLSVQCGKGKPSRGRARAEAKRARHITRSERDTRRKHLWQVRNDRQTPSFNCSSIMEDHNPSLRSGSEAVPGDRGQGNSKDRAPRAAVLAPLVHSEPAETSNDPDSSHEAKRVSSVESASSKSSTSWTPEIAEMLRSQIAKLQAALTAFIFFVLATVLGCRESPYSDIGTTTDSMSECSNPLEQSNIWTGWPGQTSGSSGSSGGGASSTSASIDTEQTTEQTSGDGGTGVTAWNQLLESECVFDCHAEENPKLLEFCRAWAPPFTMADVLVCEAMAMDAVLLRCAEECRCTAKCPSEGK